MQDQSNGGITRVTVLHGHTSMDSAHLTEDYPYGRRLRCQRREWLEYKPKQGYRFVTQTTDPRRPGEPWNKPHASTYAAWSVLVQQEPVNGEAFGRIGTMSGGYWGLGPDEHVRFTLSGALAQLDGQQRRMYDALLKRGRKHNATSWERWPETIAIMTAHRGPDGEPPSRQAMSDDHGRYLTGQEHAAARASILTGFDAYAEPAGVLATA